MFITRVFNLFAMDFHHIGIATREAEELAAVFAELTGAPVVHDEVVDGKRLIFLELDDGGLLEFLQPGGEDNIERYLGENGPGIHHVALETDDIKAALDGAREAGAELLDDQPRPGSRGTQIAFVDPKSTGGILLEFTQD
jgi:methylmalonyl-CoA/ethylmalonyl-CoA epimerase